MPVRPALDAGLPALAFTFLLAFLPYRAWAVPPTLYAQAAYESPTRAEPGKLLLIPGDGFQADDQVVYEALRETTRPLIAPQNVPATSDATSGVAPVASAVGIPYSLTVQLPTQMHPGQSYGLWVRTAAGDWSAGIRVNDARPLWFSPSYVYARGSVAGLPRSLKVIGRNLDPAGGQLTRIRLIGPQSLTLTASVSTGATGRSSSPILSRYVALAALPDYLQAGRYRIQLSRDGVSWVDLHDQILTVRPDPAPETAYYVGDPRFGGCRADDGQDDARCVLRAIAAASRAGGTIVFTAGVWNLRNANQPGVSASQGIVVPAGVSLSAQHPGSARIVRQASWQAGASKPAFTLLGHNRVTGLVFHDAAPDTPQAPDIGRGVLQLGAASPPVSLPDSIPTGAVEDIVISGNTFDRPRIAIEDAGQPMRLIFITYNEIAAYENGVLLAGNLFLTRQRFRLDDSVISHNRFMPAGYLDVARNNAAVASQVGAGYRVDFSDNVADGSSHQYLSAPDDVPGWRAGLFWHLQDSHELVLISGNRISCSADAVGDGEAIALDNNANTFAFSAPRTVIRASKDSATVSGPPLARQNGQDIPLSRYYIGHWLQLFDGPGIGQVRRITSYTIDASSGLVTFRVSPAWDVIPKAGQTRLGVGREFWQVYLLDNTVEHRSPPCLNSNRSEHVGGSIKLFAQTADSVVGGNQLSGADGIWLHENYVTPEHPCPDCGAGAFMQSFMLITTNRVEGAYRDAQGCGISGIHVDEAAAPWNDSPPPTVSYGVSVEDNVVLNANDPQDGAIGMPLAWYAGPAPNRWPLVDSLIIQGNQIAVHLPVDCAGALRTPGIGYPSNPLVWRSIQFNNSCHIEQRGTAGAAVDGALLCASHSPDSCECPAP